MRVWDLAALESRHPAGGGGVVDGPGPGGCRHVLPQPAGCDVWWLQATQSEVWAGVGGQVVVWGHE